MTDGWLADGDVTVFVMPRVKKSFDGPLQELLEKETGTEVKPLRLKDDFAEWVALRARGKGWNKGRRSPAEKALSRAFQALAAARYHMRHQPESEQELRELRDRVEALWMSTNGEG